MKKVNEYSVLDDFIELDCFINDYLYIKGKEKAIVPFNLNPVQKSYLYNRSFKERQGQGQRDVILKARQHGITTFKIAEYLHDTIINKGTVSMIIGHDDSAMQRQLQNCRIMIESLPEELRPEITKDNRGEIQFGNINSSITISTYRMQKAVSQTINNLHLTETALWTIRDLEVLIAGMTEAVPFMGNITFEGTPRGMGGFFYDLVIQAKNGLNGYKYFNYPWFINPEYSLDQKFWDVIPEIARPKKNNYRLDEREKQLMKLYNLTINQIMWRRFKITEKKYRILENDVRVSSMFAQEYECDFLSSGNSFFDPYYLIPKCNYKKPVKDHRYVHGADTAEGHKDSDYSVFYTIDIDTGETVNKIYGNFKEDDFSDKIHRIALKYGGLVGIERNNTSGGSVTTRVKSLQLEYKKKNGDVPYKLYCYKKGFVGWRTDANTRPDMLVDLEEDLRNEVLLLAKEDSIGIDELRAFQENDKGKAEAPPGFHDDHVLALAIANQMRKHYRYYFRGRRAIKVRAK